MSILKLTRFWFEFENPNKYWWLQLGCGVTAWSYNDAVNILQSSIFKSEEMPAIKSVIESVDVSVLDVNHIQPNILASNVRGVWYPMGYTSEILL